VIINRDGIGDPGVEEFCQISGLAILLRIPFDRAIAQGIAQGRLVTDIHPPFVQQFRALFTQIAMSVGFR
jgi:MinD superfamily P-loop ATPase